MMKATKEHRTTSNKLNREFKQDKPFKVLLTDITYLFYGTNQKAYLSTIKDSSTNEILSYKLPENLKINLATETIENLINNSDFRLTADAFIHS
ncbi:MAG: IS3 family transposase, partial [Suipraeoptans sp.]